MLTMQIFYTWLRSAQGSGEPYLARLAQLTWASRAHVAALDVGWQWWD